MDQRRDDRFARQEIWVSGQGGERGRDLEGDEGWGLRVFEGEEGLAGLGQVEEGERDGVTFEVWVR